MAGGASLLKRLPAFAALLFDRECGVGAVRNDAGERRREPL